MGGPHRRALGYAVCMDPYEPPTPSHRWRPRFFDVLTALLILAVLVAQLHFAFNDVRLPRDPGLYYKLLPSLYHAMSDPLVNAGELLGALVQSSGWYNLLLAAGVHLLGRGPLAFELACAGWVSLLLLGVALVARHEGSPLAGFCAAALAAAMPMVIIMGRTPWIHIPEAALAVIVLAAWQRDRGLVRWRTVLFVGMGGVLTITLRHSGLIWLGAMAPMLLWTPTATRPWRRIAVVLACWALAIVVPAMQLLEYLEAKMGARDRYATQLPEFLEQLVSNLAWPTLLVCALGLVLLNIRRPSMPTGPIRPLLFMWLLAGGALWSLFRAGLDNFTPMMAALAILAGLGLARMGSWGMIPALFAFVVSTLPQWLEKDTVVVFHSIPGFPDFTAGVHPNNHYRPWQGFAHPQVRDLLEASCPSLPQAGCIIAVDQGLFSPFTEDPGMLELFLMDLERVNLLSLRDIGGLPRLETVHGMSSYYCPERDAQWRERYPHSQALLKELMDGFELDAVWSTELFLGCTYLWMAPGGVLENPEALPEAMSPATPGPGGKNERTPRGVEQDLIPR